ncbi:MAG: fibronectin type III domain-containing protein [Thermoanaerobaculia bacterium]
MKRLSALLLLLVVGCGKRGDPHPPIPVIPKTTSDLVVTQRGSQVILSWAYPSLSTAGKTLGSIRRVVVYRVLEPLPVAPGGRDANSILPGDIDPNVPQPVAMFSKVPPITPVQFNKLKERIDSIEGANLPAATVGARLAYEDTPSFHSQDGRPVRATYAVVTEGQTARSELSNLAPIVPLDVPAPPASVTATAKPEGVVLAWTRPAKTVAGSDKPFVVGYNVYRTTTTDDDSAELPLPVNTSLIHDPTYTDVPPYGDYKYRVSAVSAGGPPRIESEASPAVTATYKDLLPPPPPTNVTALIETNGVRLIWDPSEAPDLRGYFVYRIEGDTRTRLTQEPITQPNYRDATVRTGVNYGYQVSSVDKNGNESGAAASAMVLVPKTP